METAGYDSSRPLAEQVAQRIKDYILEEKLKSGDKLPTETALAREMVWHAVPCARPSSGWSHRTF